MANYYEVLGVKQTDDAKAIKSAYIKMLKYYHPDIFKGDKSFAEQKTIEINKAYEILSDVNKRQNYDNYLIKITNSNVKNKRTILDNWFKFWKRIKNKKTQKVHTQNGTKVNRNSEQNIKDKELFGDNNKKHGDLTGKGSKYNKEDNKRLNVLILLISLVLLLLVVIVVATGLKK